MGAWVERNVQWRVLESINLLAAPAPWSADALEASNRGGSTIRHVADLPGEALRVRRCAACRPVGDRDQGEPDRDGIVANATGLPRGSLTQKGYAPGRTLLPSRSPQKFKLPGRPTWPFPKQGTDLLTDLASQTCRLNSQQPCAQAIEISSIVAATADTCRKKCGAMGRRQPGGP